MIDVYKVSGDLLQSTRELLTQLTAFDPGDFNKRCFPGKWTAAEVAEHLLLLDTNISTALNGPVEKPERDPDEKIPRIKHVFENFDRQLTSPGIIFPSEMPKDLMKMITGIENARMMLMEVIQAKDLTEICTGFVHPNFGPFSRVEWIYFSIYHGARHLEQLRRLRAAAG